MRKFGYVEIDEFDNHFYTKEADIPKQLILWYNMPIELCLWKGII